MLPPETDSQPPYILPQDIAPFEQPKVELEQYPTGAHLASRMLYTIENSYGDFGGKLVADLGAGTVSFAICRFSI